MGTTIIGADPSSLNLGIAVHEPTNTLAIWNGQRIRIASLQTGNTISKVKLHHTKSQNTTLTSLSSDTPNLSRASFASLKFSDNGTSLSIALPNDDIISVLSAIANIRNNQNQIITQDDSSLTWEVVQTLSTTSHGLILPPTTIDMLSYNQSHPNSDINNNTTLSHLLVATTTSEHTVVLYDAPSCLTQDENDNHDDDATTDGDKKKKKKKRRSSKRHKPTSKSILIPTATLTLDKNIHNEGSSSKSSNIIHAYFSSNSNTLSIVSHSSEGKVKIHEQVCLNHNDNEMNNNNNNCELAIKGQIVISNTEQSEDTPKNDTPSDSSSLDLEQNKKRKANHSSIVLGPGDVGKEASKVTDFLQQKNNKRAKTQDGNESDNSKDHDFDDLDGAMEADDANMDGVTIAERLALLSSQLEQESDDELDMDDQEENQKNNASIVVHGTSNNDDEKIDKFVAKTATSDSLATLLRQALRSNDDANLEIALQVKDKQIIENSILALASGEGDHDATNPNLQHQDQDPILKDILALLTKLISRIARNPKRAELLSHWIRHILIVIITSPTKLFATPRENDDDNDNKDIDQWHMGKAQIEVAKTLGPLRALLEDRVQNMSLLLQLQGRLHLLGQL